MSISYAAAIPAICHFNFYKQSKRVSVDWKLLGKLLDL